MDRVKSWAASEDVPSVALNGIQDQAASVLQIRGWRGRRPILESDGADVTVGDHDGYAVGATQAGATFVPADGSHNVTLGTLDPDSFYCVYAFNDGGDTEYEVHPYDVDGSPDGSLNFKNDDPTRIYVGCFPTDASGAPVPFVMVGGEYLYRRSRIAFSGDPLLVKGAFTTLTTWADVACAKVVSPRGRFARLRGELTNATGEVQLELRTKGDTTLLWTVANAKGGTQYFACDIELDAARKAEARITELATSSGHVAQIYLSSWREF